MADNRLFRWYRSCILITMTDIHVFLFSCKSVSLTQAFFFIRMWTTRTTLLLPVLLVLTSFTFHFSVIWVICSTWQNRVKNASLNMPFRRCRTRNMKSTQICVCLMISFEQFFSLPTLFKTEFNKQKNTF